MKTVWDDPKRLSNRLKHGIDFADLTSDFFDTSVIIPAKDNRLMAIGELDGATVIAVVFTKLGAEAVSVISMRRADRKERMLWND